VSPVAEGIGIVVLSYGGGGEHEELLEGLLSEGVDPGSILIVHNPAEANEAPSEPPSGCVVVQSPRNLGYAGGMNLGIARQRQRGHELLLLLTHDARLRAGTYGVLEDAARRRPDIGVIGPVLVLAGTEERFSCGGITRANGTNAHLTELPAGDGNGVSFCDWVDGGTMLVRVAALERAGGFDERFWGYCEEADLCLRVRRAGFRVGVVDALAEQDPGGPKRPGAWAYLLTRNGAEYARRAVGLRGAVTIEARALALVAGQLLRAALRLVRRRPGGPAQPWATAVGTARGALDFLRRRWGPPPRNLPGTGDVTNA
jgi:N-acetylglucosaminyl-diphospho-decaprenol L-rhamnosyltransferase